MFRFCTYCGQSVEVPDDTAAGASVACPACGRQVSVNQTDQLTPVADESGQATTGKKRFVTVAGIATVIAAGVIALSMLMRYLFFTDWSKSDMVAAFIIASFFGGWIACILWAAILALPIAGLEVLIRKISFRKAMSHSYTPLVLIFGIGYAFSQFAIDLTRTATDSLDEPSQQISEQEHKLPQSLEDSYKIELAEAIKQRFGAGAALLTAAREAEDSPLKQQIVRIVIGKWQICRARFYKALERRGNLHQTLLDADRVASDVGWYESEEALSTLVDILKEYRSSGDKEMATIMEAIDECGFAERKKEEVARRLETDLRPYVTLINEYWNIEQANLALLSESVDHLKATREFWEPNDGTFMFQRDEELRTFQRIMLRISAGEARHLEIAHQLQQAILEEDTADELPQ